ncbi:GntR family transcriptional regulator [Micromonospora chalcea]|uniref:GntR family transcriptional regulator n=1 Tax=Micromonospora chalcea TaxID=1874 RepID=UPI001656B0BE|nr:GntR family transcriptional regulator [Micromonospora chalcea]MBC8989275.1 GntR family transcriptional regulator [Micromonospora chalcea]
MPPPYGQPRYRAIAADLRSRIDTGALRVGALLPSESRLMAEFRASRGTIRQAILVLREEGLVVTEHGRGTLIAAHKGAEVLAGDSESETRQHQTAADDALAQLFGIPVNTPLALYETVVRRNGATIRVDRTYRLQQDRI